MIASSHDSIYLSYNKGVVWKSVFGFSGQNINKLFVNGIDIYAGSDNFLIYSNDSGVSWTSINDGFPEKDIVNKIMVGKDVYIRTNDKDVYGFDNKSGWFFRCLSENNNFDVSQYIKNDSIIFAIGSKTYLSFDTLKTWIKVYDKALYNLIFRRDTVLASSETEGILMSVDKGKTWLQSNIGINNISNGSNSLFEYGKDIYCYQSAGLYYKSSNRGETWQNAGTKFMGLNGIYKVVSKNGIVIAQGAYPPTYILNADNVSWKHMNNSRIELPLIGNNKNNVFTVSVNGVYHYSGDSTWRKISRGLYYFTSHAGVNSNEFTFNEYKLDMLEIADTILYGLSNKKLYKRFISDCFNVIAPPKFYNCYTDYSGQIVNVRFNLNWHKSANNGVTHYDLYDDFILGQSVGPDVTSFSYRDYNSSDIHTIKIYASVDGDYSLPSVIKLQSTAGDSTNFFTAVSFIVKDQNYILYPNPAHDYIYLSGDVISEKISLDIIDIEGRVIYTLKNYDGKNINLDYFEKGEYIMRINTPSGKIYRRFIKR